MEFSKESIISWKSMHPTISNNFLTSIILEHIIHQVPLFSITLSEFDPFLSVQWPCKAVNLTAQTEFSAVMLVLGKMQLIPRQTFVNWCHKFTHCPRCLSTLTIMTTDLHRRSLESIMYNYQNGLKEILISLLPKWEGDLKAVTYLNTSTTGSIWFSGTNKEVSQQFNTWIFSSHLLMKMPLI